MKKLIIITMILVFAIGVNAQQAEPSKEYLEVLKQKHELTKWWQDARFGMFIHFGAYAVPARGEWVKSKENMTNEQYQKYIDQFYPSEYNPKEWARVAKQAGMKYAVLTAKHHDGYCLFDSKYTDYKLSNKMNGRDYVREYLEAFRAEGIKVGLYYSLIDWHHKDYPNVGNHPMRKNKQWSKKKVDWDNYLKYMHGQVEELVTNYGKLDILWFDYSFDKYENKMWKAKDLMKMVRKHQPQVIVDNRLSVHSNSVAKGEFSGFGDFTTPEQTIPPKPVHDVHGKLIPWETCLTLNKNWGYNSTDDEWKSPQLVVHSLVNCVSKGGNLLLNVGPDAKGNIPDKSKEILAEVGEWMKKNGESIYGCGISEIEKQDWGMLTQKENTIYAHFMYPFIGHLPFHDYADKIEQVFLLRDGTEAATRTKTWGNPENVNTMYLNVSEPTNQTYNLPDPFDTVFKIQLK